MDSSVAVVLLMLLFERMLRLFHFGFTLQRFSVDVYCFHQGLESNAVSAGLTTKQTLALITL